MKELIFIDITLFTVLVTGRHDLCIQFCAPQKRITR